MLLVHGGEGKRHVAIPYEPYKMWQVWGRHSVSPPFTIPQNLFTSSTFILSYWVWVHWLVWNIDPTTVTIPENSAPGVEGTTDYDKPGYDGPCPPSGVHRYFFRAYALNTMLDLTAETDITALKVEMNGHVLASAELLGVYQRK
jgi:hypothetical protein